MARAPGSAGELGTNPYYSLAAIALAKPASSIEHYEPQSDEEAVAEDEAAYESTTHTAMEIPVDLQKFANFSPSGWDDQRLTVIPRIDTVIANLMNTDDSLPRFVSNLWDEVTFRTREHG